MNDMTGFDQILVAEVFLTAFFIIVEVVIDDKRRKKGAAIVKVIIGAVLVTIVTCLIAISMNWESTILDKILPGHNNGEQIEDSESESQEGIVSEEEKEDNEIEFPRAIHMTGGSLIIYPEELGLIIYKGGNQYSTLSLKSKVTGTISLYDAKTDKLIWSVHQKLDSVKLDDIPSGYYYATVEGDSFDRKQSDVYCFTKSGEQEAYMGITEIDMPGYTFSPNFKIQVTKENGDTANEMLISIGLANSSLYFTRYDGYLVDSNGYVCSPDGEVVEFSVRDDATVYIGKSGENGTKKAIPDQNGIASVIIK